MKHFSTLACPSVEILFHENILNSKRFPNPYEVMGYGFACDGLNRLKDAQYGSMVSTTWSPDADYTYDLNGNILSLNRKGQTATNTYGNIDMLSYSY